MKMQGFTNYDAFAFNRRMLDETSYQDDNFRTYTAALEQGASDLLFERLHLSRERRLRDAQPFRRLVEAACSTTAKNERSRSRFTGRRYASYA